MSTCLTPVGPPWLYFFSVVVVTVMTSRCSRMGISGSWGSHHIICLMVGVWVVILLNSFATSLRSGYAWIMWIVFMDSGGTLCWSIWFGVQVIRNSRSHQPEVNRIAPSCIVCRLMRIHAETSSRCCARVSPRGGWYAPQRWRVEFSAPRWAYAVVYHHPMCWALDFWFHIYY